MTGNLYSPLLTACLLTLYSAGSAADTLDRRQVYQHSSPSWLQAIGKLSVPGNKTVDGYRQHHTEDCSATLLATKAGAHANIIVTAWHCLEFYADLTKDITFTLSSASGQTTVSNATRLADGGGMYADWAILKLAQPLPASTATALAINPGPSQPHQAVVMAGYSADAGKGALGQRLTYDADCAITQAAGTASESNCLAFKGASGGAVVQLSSEGIAQLTGVISEGNGQGISTFVPVERFRSALNRYLK